MPTDEEWEGMGRKVDMKIEADEDAELGVEALEAMLAGSYCVGWNEAIEAAAELVKGLHPAMSRDMIAAAIRKLKKP